MRAWTGVFLFCYQTVTEAYAMSDDLWSEEHRAIEFGADGIRGIVGKWPLVPEGAQTLGVTLGKFLRKRAEHPVVVLGRDTRPSGIFLSEGLEGGMSKEGVDVIDLGVMTTPGIAYLTRRLQANLGVIISASHNPSQYNGIKLVGQNGLRLQREEEIEIEMLCAHTAVTEVVARAELGQQADASHLIEMYIGDHVRCCPAESLAGLRLVLDCANGAAARVAPTAFARLGADVITINDDLRGHRINFACGSEYARQQPRDLAAIVQQHDAMYGFAFDGDGDRLVVVDAEGNLFDGDDLLFVLALYFHSRNELRHNTIVTTRSGNAGLETSLEKFGVRITWAGKGDKALEAEMWRGDFLLGGEPTGNIILNDGHHTAADAVYTALFLAGVLVQDPGKTLLDRVAHLQKLPQVFAFTNIAEKKPLEEMMALRLEKKRLREILGDACRIETWYSSTEPDLLRVMVEGTAQSTLEQVEQAARSLCQIVQRETRMEGKVVTVRASERARGL